MENWFIPSVKNQTLVLDRLAEFYFSWISSAVELMSEMTWEISFKELRSTILYLVEFWYIQRSYTWKWNEFYVKITKKWISHYEKIFQPEQNLHVKDSFLDKIKNLSEGINSIKWIATWAVAVFTIFWVSFHEEIWNNFSANVFKEQVQEHWTWVKVNFTEREAIRFLKNKIWRHYNFSCVIKNTEAVCKIVQDVRFNNEIKDFNFSQEKEKIISNKEMILEKMEDWGIKMMK